MSDIYFIRHGQASFGTADYDRLSPLGHQQSEWLGQHLRGIAPKFDKVICGTLRRHRETLAAIRKGIDIPEAIEDARLNEMEYHAMEVAYGREFKIEEPKVPADLEALFGRVLAAWSEGGFSFDGESFATFQNRILAALVDHCEDGQKVLIISSGGPKCMIIRHILDLGIPALTELILKTYNASYSRLEVSNSKFRLRQFNSISHFESPERRHAQTLI